MESKRTEFARDKAFPAQQAAHIDFVYFRLYGPWQTSGSELNPARPIACGAVIFYSIDDFERAVEEATKAVEINADSSDAFATGFPFKSWLLFSFEELFCTMNPAIMNFIQKIA